MKEIIDEFLKSIILKQVEGAAYLLPTITDLQIDELHEKLKVQYEHQEGVYSKETPPHIQGQMVRIHYPFGSYGNGNFHVESGKWFLNDEQLREITQDFTYTKLLKY